MDRRLAPPRRDGRLEELRQAESALLHRRRPRLLRAGGGVLRARAHCAFGPARRLPHRAAEHVAFSGRVASRSDGAVLPGRQCHRVFSCTGRWRADDQRSVAGHHVGLAHHGAPAQRRLRCPAVREVGRRLTGLRGGSNPRREPRLPGPDLVRRRLRAMRRPAGPLLPEVPDRNSAAAGLLVQLPV